MFIWGQVKSTECIPVDLYPDIIYKNIFDFRCDDNNAYWHSSLIVERIDKRTLLTTTNSVYKIVGDIQKNITLENGKI